MAKFKIIIFVTQLAILGTGCLIFNNTRESILEGSSCPLENGGRGVCKKIGDCPIRVQQVQQGIRFTQSNGRCGFDKLIEIVCCPHQVPDRGFDQFTTSTTYRAPVTRDDENGVGDKLGVRPATLACDKYRRKIDKIDGVVAHIFNGTLASDKEFPFAVALGYRKDDGIVQYDCGGTLISRKHVLTAAHCVSNKQGSVPFEARLGSNNLTDDSRFVQRKAIADIIAHPEYRPSQAYHDLAILKLESKVQLNENVQPICLQTTPVDNLSFLASRDLATLIVIGWGSTSYEIERSNELFKTAPLNIVDHAECNKKYKNIARLPNGITDRMICMLDKDPNRRSDSCQGDSGGPLLFGSPDPKSIMGVTSFGIVCGGATPGVYTSVYSYLDWIETVVWPNKKKSFED